MKLTKTQPLTKAQKLVREFFDFYSINELYLRCGGFRDVGYDTYPIFVSKRAEDKIKEVYEDVVNKFYDKVYAALVTSVRSELRHFRSNAYSPTGYHYGVTGLYKFFQDKHGLSREVVENARFHPGVYPEIAYTLFYGVRWESSYGGKKWAKGAKSLIDARSVETTEDKVFWIDSVLDLYHNNGHMLDKTEFCALSEKNVHIGGHDCKPLNYRARARSIMGFIPFNSSKVANLVIPQKNKLTFA